MAHFGTEGGRKRLTIHCRSMWTPLGVVAPFARNRSMRWGLTPGKAVGHERVAGVGIQQTPFDSDRSVEAREHFTEEGPLVSASQFDGPGA